MRTLMLKNVAKLAVAGGVVAAIFFSLTTGSPEGVQEAEADILDLVPGSVFAGQNTTEIVAKSGLRPRAYEVNGNKVLFAVGETDVSPMGVLEYYQEQFVTAGINTEKYLDTPNGGRTADEKKASADKGLKQLHAMMRGEVIPYFASNDYVSMGGPIPRDKALPELIKEWEANPPESKQRIFKGFRFIDAQRKSNGKTRVTSVWADEKFDFKAMKDPNNAQLGPNLKVPACPACELVARTRSLEADEPHALEQYKTFQDPDTAIEFYRKAMLGRGWELTDTSAAMDYVASRVPDMPFNTKGKFLSFAKNDEFVTVTAFRNPEAGTIVSVAEMK
ncbi:MAG: hypothetical protein R3E66_22735 [bacterium]